MQWYANIFFRFLKDSCYKLSIGCNFSHFLIIFFWKLIKNSYNANKNLKKLHLEAKFSNFRMALVITQNRVMNFVSWCYEFSFSTVSFSVYGLCICCEKQKKFVTRTTQWITQPRSWRVENKQGGEKVRKLTRPSKKLFWRRSPLSSALVML